MGVHGLVSFRIAPRQRKLTQGWKGVHFGSKRFQPLAEDHVQVRNSRIAELAHPMMIKGDFNAYCNWYKTERFEEKPFIEFHNFRAIGYYKDIMGLPGAVEPWIADGMSKHMPVYGGDKQDWALWCAVADPDNPGQPLATDVFERKWAQANTTPTNNPIKNVFHHIIKNHEGELRSMENGTWVRVHGVPPDALFHEQFAMDASQFWMCKGVKSGKGQGKNKGKGRKSLWRDSPASGTGKGKVNQPLAVADLKVPGFENRILQIEDEVTFWVWTGGLTSLSRLAHALGPTFTFPEIYGLYCAMDIRVTHRVHSWPNQIRSDAAILRKRETGFFGHRR